jgi:hypothetical protein
MAGNQDDPPPNGTARASLDPGEIVDRRNGGLKEELRRALAARLLRVVSGPPAAARAGSAASRVAEQKFPQFRIASLGFPQETCCRDIKNVAVARLCIFSWQPGLLSSVHRRVYIETASSPASHVLQACGSWAGNCLLLVLPPFFTLPGLRTLHTYCIEPPAGISPALGLAPRPLSPSPIPPTGTGLESDALSCFSHGR